MTVDADVLVSGKVPEHSARGILLAIIAMPLLSRAKKKLANQLGSAAVHADAKQTDFCVYLSAILLVGLLLNAGRRWRWADPTAALIMVSLIANEGGGGNERQDLLRLAWMNLKAGN